MNRPLSIVISARANRYVHIGLVLVFLLLSYLSLSKGHNWGDDFASYIMQGQAISSGHVEQFLVENKFTIDESTKIIGPVAYPWGMPIIYACINIIFGGNIFQYKLFNLICSMVFLISSGAFIAKRLGKQTSILYYGLFSLNPWLIRYNDHILSDIPFFTISTLIVILLDQIYVQKKIIVGMYLDTIVLGIMVGIAFSIRTTAVLFFPLIGSVGFISYYLNRQNNKQYIIEINKNTDNHTSLLQNIFTALPFVAGFLFIVALVEYFLPSASSKYLVLLSQTNHHVILNNLHYYIYLPAEFFSTFHNKFLYRDYRAIFILIYILVSIYVLMGIFVSIRRYYVFAIYILLILVFYIIWPAQEGLRFFLPAMPFYVFFLLNGINLGIANKKVMIKIFSYGFGCILLTLLIAFFVSDIQYALSNTLHVGEQSEGPYSAPFEGVVEFISQNTPKGSSIVFFKPRAMRMRTGRSSRLVGSEEYLNRGDNYICLFKRELKDQQISLIRAEQLTSQGHMKKVYENNEYVLYKYGF